MKKEVYVVPHSHWDAEWYFTCEDSHVLLIENMDYLIDLLERDCEFNSYSFDGLSIVLDEYMEVRPEQKERLCKLIQDRRLFVGPWYTQTDSLLVRSESVVRNLVYGVKTAKGFGHCMNIGYLPDIFGQHAYLPSFFQDLGITFSVLQRGVYTELIKDNLNFYWRSPNQKMIATNCLYFGYGPGKFLSDEPNYLNYRLLPILDQLCDMNQNTNLLLLPSGGDQVLANKQFPSIVNRLNKLGLDYQFKMSNYEDYMEDVFSTGEFKKIIDGELYACQKSRMHRTCHSTRVDIKQQTHTSEHLLLDHLEPLLTLAQSMGLEYPKVQMDDLWKKVFASHAHNGIEASNADQVNANVKNRLASVERSARSLINLYKKKISKMISNKLNKDHLLVVFNCDIHTLDQLVEAVVFTREPQFSIVDCVMNEKVNYEIIEQEELMGGQNVIVTAQGEKLEKVPNYFRTKILLDAKGIGAIGYHTYSIEEEKVVTSHSFAKQKNTIANEYFEITLEHSALRLKQKEKNKEIKDFIEFVDCCDDGDEFDFAPLIDDKVIRHAEFTLLGVECNSLFEKMKVKSVILLPENKKNRLCANAIPVEINTCFELRKQEKLIRVTHTLENNCIEHRLRIHLKTGIQDCKSSYADQGYSIIERESTNPYLADWKTLGFVEKPMPIYTMENIAYIKGDEYAMGVITNGIKEYEVICEENALALTLFRSVGLLGKDDTPWRPGRASGINNKVVHTPDAWMLQNLKFEYAIVMSDFDEVEIFKNINLYREHYMTYQLQQLNTFEERLERFMIPLSEACADETAALFNVSNDAIFMSMCKNGNQDNEIQIRLFNPTDDVQETSLLSDKIIAYFKTDLLGNKVEDLDCVFTIQPKDYVSLCIRIEEGKKK